MKEKLLPSYNLDLRNVMQHSHTVERPVKVTNFHEKIYEFSKKPVWTLGNQSKEYSAKLIPFERVKRIVEKMNQITSLQEVLTKIMIDGTVNMIIYIDFKETEPVKINTQYGIKKKQEVIEYDNLYRDQIKFTLCNAHIDSIAKNGVYKPQYVKVNIFNDKYLKKTAATVIKESAAQIEIKEVQKTTTFQNVSFRQETLNFFEPSLFRKICKRRAQPVGVFIVCSNWSSKPLVNN